VSNAVQFAKHVRIIIFAHPAMMPLQLLQIVLVWATFTMRIKNSAPINAKKIMEK